VGSVCSAEGAGADFSEHKNGGGGENSSRAENIVTSEEELCSSEPVCASLLSSCFIQYGLIIPEYIVYWNRSESVIQKLVMTWCVMCLVSVSERMKCFMVLRSALFSLETGHCLLW